MTYTDTGPLRREDAAQYLRERHGLRISAATLAKYASVGNGPAYRRAGQVAVYAAPDLDIWAEARIVDPTQPATADEQSASDDGYVWNYA